MDATLKTRLVLALKQASGAARSSEAQIEASELASILEAMDDPPQSIVAGAQAFVANASAEPPYDEIRTSVQTSTAKAEKAAYAKANRSGD